MECLHYSCDNVELTYISCLQNITFEGFEEIVALVIDEEDKGQIRSTDIITCLITHYVTSLCPYRRDRK